MNIDRRQLLQSFAASALVPLAASPHPGDGLGEAKSLDNRPYPAYDYTRANKLPREMIGYWEKSFDVAGTSVPPRSTSPPETPIRCYFTVIAVPDGVDTTSFLAQTGWRDVADQREEALFVLEPGPQGWGDAIARGPLRRGRHELLPGQPVFLDLRRTLSGRLRRAADLPSRPGLRPIRSGSSPRCTWIPPDCRTSTCDAFGSPKFDGTTDAGYTTVVFPAGFRLIKYDETVLPTWYINPAQRSIAAQSCPIGRRPTTRRVTVSAATHSAPSITRLHRLAAGG